MPLVGWPWPCNRHLRTVVTDSPVPWFTTCGILDHQVNTRRWSILYLNCPKPHCVSAHCVWQGFSNFYIFFTWFIFMILRFQMYVKDPWKSPKKFNYEIPDRLCSTRYWSIAVFPVQSISASHPHFFHFEIERAPLNLIFYAIQYRFTSIISHQILSLWVLTRKFSRVILKRY